jgi:hypothetical protein
MSTKNPGNHDWSKASSVTLPIGRLARRSGRFAFIGYAPDAAPEESISEGLLWREGLSRILANADLILEKPEYFYCQPVDAYLSSPYFGGGPIPLGVLIHLWEDGVMLDDCPGCGGRLYAVGGCWMFSYYSLLGVCRDCGEWQKACGSHSSRQERGFPEFMFTAKELLKTFRNEPVIERGKRRRFDWAEGLVGEETPDRTVRPAAEGIDLETLFELLG